MAVRLSFCAPSMRSRQAQRPDVVLQLPLAGTHKSSAIRQEIFPQSRCAMECDGCAATAGDVYGDHPVSPDARTPRQRAGFVRRPRAMEKRHRLTGVRIRAYTAGAAAAPGWLRQNLPDSQLRPRAAHLALFLKSPVLSRAAAFRVALARKTRLNLHLQPAASHDGIIEAADHWKPNGRHERNDQATEPCHDYCNCCHDARIPAARPGFSRVTSTLAGMPPLANLYSLSPSPMIAGC